MIRIIYLLLIWIHGMNWMLFAKDIVPLSSSIVEKYTYQSWLRRFGKWENWFWIFSYSFAVALERLCSFLLIPLYASTFTVAEFGVIDIVQTTIGVVLIFAFCNWRHRYKDIIMNMRVKREKFLLLLYFLSYFYWCYCLFCWYVFMRKH